MATSISALQNLALSDGTIDSLGKSKTDYSSTNRLPFTEQVILKYVANFIITAQNILRAQGKVDTGELSTSIGQGDLINNNGNYSIQIGYPEDSQGAKYYDFVNKGVSGFKSKMPLSIYSFKSEYPSINGPMVKAIEKWLARKGLQTLLESVRTSKSTLQKKRLKLSKISPSKQKAWLIATSIKRKGIERSGFIDTSLATVFGPKFYDEMSKAIGADVQVYLKQANQLSK